MGRQSDGLPRPDHNYWVDPEDVDETHRPYETEDARYDRVFGQPLDDEQP